MKLSSDIPQHIHDWIERLNKQVGELQIMLGEKEKEKDSDARINNLKYLLEHEEKSKKRYMKTARRLSWSVDKLLEWLWEEGGSQGSLEEFSKKQLKELDEKLTENSKVKSITLIEQVTEKRPEVDKVIKGDFVQILKMREAAPDQYTIEGDIEDRLDELNRRWVKLEMTLLPSSGIPSIPNLML